MNQVTVDIKDILVEEGLGEFATTKKGVWSIQLHALQPNPDNMLALFDVTPQDGKSYNTDTVFQKAALQVIARANTSPDAYAKLREVAKVLVAQGSWAVGDVAYKNITSGFGPTPLLKDEKGRHRVSQNFNVFREFNETSA